MSRRSRSPHVQETIPAINRTALCGLERHGSLNATKRAIDHYIYSDARKGLAIGLQVRRYSGVLFHLAGLASLRFVGQSFISEEFLLTSREYEFLEAIHAFQHLVLVHDGPPEERFDQVNVTAIIA